MKRIVFYLVVIYLSGSSLRAEFQVNTRIADDQTDAAIAMDAEGNCVIAWSSYRGDGDSGSIFARRFDASLNPISDQFQVNVTTTGNQTNPSIAMNEGGSFVIVWQGGNTDDENIFARRFDAHGNPIGGELFINSQTSGRSLYPKAAMNSDGSFVVVWERSGSIPPFDEVWYVLSRIYDRNGNPHGKEFKAHPISGSRYPDVAMDSYGNFMITWTQQKELFYPANVILYQRFNADGSVRKPAVYQEVSSKAFNTLAKPAIATDRSGYFVIAWDQDAMSATGDDIYARRYSFDGSDDGSQFKVNTTDTGTQLNPDIAMNEYGECIIVWNSESNESGKDIFAQRIDKLGKCLGEEFRVNRYIADDQKYAAAAIKRNGDFVTVWQSWGQGGYGYDIFAAAGPEIQSADFNHDGIVDFKDYACFAEKWQKKQNTHAVDLVDDNVFNLLDWAAFYEQWLEPVYDFQTVDMNHDGKVDFKDYAIWASIFSKTGSHTEDITGDGTVDMSDLEAMLFYWAEKNP